MSGYIGTTPVPQSTQSRQSFTATASQTTFNTSGYTAGFVDVYLNGVKLVDGTDFTATNGSDVVLTVAASASDVVDVVMFGTFEIANTSLTDATINDTLTLKNATEEDTDGGRESTIIFKGEQSGGEISTLAEIEASHDGASDDEKGDLIFRTNDGSDGSSPTERLRIDSTGKSTFKDDVGIEGETPTLQMYDTNVTNNVTDISYDEQYIIDIDPNNARGNSGLAIKTDGTEKYRFIDTAAHGGGLGIGTTAPLRQLHISNTSANSEIAFTAGINGTSSILFGDGLTGTDVYRGYLQYQHANDAMLLATAATERMRIDNGGHVLVGKTSNAFATAGTTLYQSGETNITRDNGTPIYIRRNTSDGTLISLYQDGNEEGNIIVSGSTVSYNGGHLSRWSRLTSNNKDTSIVKGTVMTNLDEMVVWSHDAVVEGEEFTNDLGRTAIATADDVRDAYTEDNEQLNCMAVSSVEGDPNVAGVFVNWDESDDFNDMNVAMTGDMVIRIAQGTTVARGDLLMSAGDGTAKPQDDDIVRSKTIAKVTSTNVSHTYDDGSFLVPCVLMAC